MIYNNVLEMIHRTPMVNLCKVKEKFQLQANIIAKIEKNNPFGSIKDRTALMMLTKAKEEGLINDETIIIEPTSGNTGIALAAISSYYGNKAIFTMPESMSIERQKLLKAYGAEVVLTPASLGMDGAIVKANQLAKEYKNSFIPSQFENQNNPLVHYLYTASEIDEVDNIGAIVAGIGTGGTISGIGKYFKEKNKQVKIVGVEPFESPVITQGVKGPHKIQGIGAGFVPKTFESTVVDQVVTIKSSEAIDATKMLATTESIFVGISSGAALAAAINLAKDESMKGKNIVVIFPDSGERYLSILGE